MGLIGLVHALTLVCPAILIQLWPLYNNWPDKVPHQRLQQWHAFLLGSWNWLDGESHPVQWCLQLWHPNYWAVQV